MSKIVVAIKFIELAIHVPLCPVIYIVIYYVIKKKKLLSDYYKRCIYQLQLLNPGRGLDPMFGGRNFRMFYNIMFVFVYMMNYELTYF